MSGKETRAFIEFVHRYGPRAGAEGPVLMVREVFGAKPDLWQEEVLRDFGRGERRISIRACHGPGKTTVAAWIFWNQVLCRFPQKTVATAPSRGQLEDALVSEILAWYSKLPEPLQGLFEIKKNRIELKAAPEESFFSARTARAENPEALQGVHSEHVLLIADEASGVPEAIFEAAAGSMSGHSATTLLLGNPVRSSGFFFDTHHKLRDMWRVYHVTGVEGAAGIYSPRISADFVEDIARRYGEESNAYRIRVLGEFPRADADTIIPYELIVSAQQRDIFVPPAIPEFWGLDVARFGDDKNALVRRNAVAVLPDIKVWGGVDLMQTAGKVKALWDELPPERRPREILVDVIGLGAGVVDRLAEQQLPVRGINVSETASVGDRYRNLRTELWFRCREWLDARSRVLPSGSREAEDMAAQLALLRYEHTSSGKLMAEPKRAVKKRGYDSPNVADALMLTFASDLAGLALGSRETGFSSVPWDQPVKLNRPMV